MKRFKKAVALSLVAVIMLSGCNKKQSDNPLDNMSKDELKQQIVTLQNNYNSLASEYDKLNVVNQALSTENVPSSAISVTGDGTGRYSFNSVDSKIIFPASFQYPGTVPTDSTGSINIVHNVQITPGSNWIAKLNGSSLEIEHSSGISGTVKVGKLTANYDKTRLQTDVLEQWFINSNTQVAYSEIFINSVMNGVQAITPTMIDSENAMLRCGMASCGDVALVYIFVYRGEQDLTKDESILNVLNTISISGNKLSIEI